MRQAVEDEEFEAAAQHKKSIKNIEAQLLECQSKIQERAQNDLDLNENEKDDQIDMKQILIDILDWENKNFNGQINISP